MKQTGEQQTTESERRRIAVAAMQAILSNPSANTITVQGVAYLAVRAADELIAELAKKNREGHIQ